MVRLGPEYNDFCEARGLAECLEEKVLSDGILEVSAYVVFW